MTSSHTALRTFDVEHRRLDLRFRAARLLAREWITPQYVRVRLAGDDLVGFDSPGAADHVRLFFPGTDGASVDELRAAPSREYTPVAWGDGWLDLELAVHDGDGIGSRWAAQAPLGAPAAVGGPRGSQVLVGAPDAWFLAGDETAVPAIRRLAALAGPGAAVTILVEVPDASHEIPIDGRTDVEYVYRDSRSAGTALATRLGTIDATARPRGTVFGFVAAEQSVVRSGRALLLDRWDLDPAHAVVKGYWKSGDTEYHAPH